MDDVGREQRLGSWRVVVFQAVVLHQPSCGRRTTKYCRPNTHRLLARSRRCCLVNSSVVSARSVRLFSSGPCGWVWVGVYVPLRSALAPLSVSKQK